MRDMRRQTCYDVVQQLRSFVCLRVRNSREFVQVSDLSQRRTVDQIVQSVIKYLSLLVVRCWNLEGRNMTFLNRTYEAK
jgi:hypothetical protein